MTDLSQIPDHQLTEDRAASVADIHVCRMALITGTTHHKDGMPVQERIDTNLRIIDAIDAEMARRALITDEVTA